MAPWCKLDTPFTDALSLDVPETDAPAELTTALAAVSPTEET